MIAARGFTSVDVSAHRGIRGATTTDAFSRAERERLLRLLQENGLRVGAVVTHAGLADRVHDDGGGLDLISVVDLAADVGAEAVTVHIGVGGKPERALCVAAIRRACDRGERAGVHVLLDALVPGSLVTTPAEFEAFAHDVDRPGFGWNADPAFVSAVGAELAPTLQSLMAFTRHAHLKDVTGRWPDVRWQVPGDGDLDWAGLHGQLGDVHVSVEVIAGPDHADTTLEVALDRSSAVLRQTGWLT